MLLPEYSTAMERLRQSLLSAERVRMPYHQLFELWNKSLVEAQRLIENETDLVSFYTTFIYVTRRYKDANGMRYPFILKLVESSDEGD